MASTGRRGPVIAAVAGATAIVVIVLVALAAGGSDYTVHARFVSASQIVKGNQVKVSGVAVGFAIGYSTFVLSILIEAVYANLGAPSNG